MGLTQEYFTYWEHFRKLYGPKIALLQQRGKFYEMYEYCPSLKGETVETSQNNIDVRLMIKFKNEQINLNENLDENKAYGNATEIAAVLGNFQITSCNKKMPHSLTNNPLMVGLPHISYDIHRSTLLMNGYTIIRVDEQHNGKVITRAVTEIVSPATEIRNSHLQVKKNIVCIYIEVVKPKTNMEKNMLLTGIASVDLSTGKNMLSEIYSKEHDELYALQEIYRFLCVMQPLEVILYLNKVPESNRDNYVYFIREQLNIESYEFSKVYVNSIEAQFFDINYQNQMLMKAFSNFLSAYDSTTNSTIPVANINVIDKLNIERLNYGRIAYCLLLQYCHNFNERLISSLQMPEISYIDESKHLILTYNSAEQFNLVPKYEDILQKVQIDSIFSIVNNTKTKMGERFLKTRLLHPITNIEELNLSYAYTEEMLKNENIHMSISKYLSRFPDIEKLHRKLQLKSIYPKELGSLMSAYITIVDLYKLLTPNPIFAKLQLPSEEILQFNNNLTFLFSTFRVENLNNCKITSNAGGKISRFEAELHCCPINLGYDPELDAILQNLKMFTSNLDAICEHLTAVYNATGKTTEKITYALYHENKKDENETSVYIEIAKTKAEAIIRSPHLNKNICGDMKTEYVSSTYYLTSPILSQHFENIAKYHIMMEARVAQLYNGIIEKLAKNSYIGLNNFICMVDFIQSNAITARKNKYHCPKIIPNATNESYISCKELRHPLSEKLVRTEFVANDLEVGKRCKGMLLYGVNSSGKSVLVKSAVIAIVMAQAGMHVAAQMEYWPYTSIITRLSGNDDLIRNKSSFIVEIVELGVIIKNATASTFVAADELCRGTEIDSAVAITLTAVENLINQRSCFMFSSHFFELPEYEIVKRWLKSEVLNISHLSVHYDTNIDKLVYERKLKPGTGTNLYGIDVCASLGFPSEFIQRAKEILIQGPAGDTNNEFVKSRKSRYNSKVYVDVCKLCGSEENVHQHHVQEQNTAVNGFIGNYSKNDERNLLSLCENCHLKKIHGEGKEIVKVETLNSVLVTTK